ncbi:peptidylprolyl isomerase [Enterococcus sp.]|uniref:peptidylprolyl isomerase n=1 Tax=Enterococcus sp. TaxID=35783 RepID=UPI002FCB0EFD
MTKKKIILALATSMSILALAACSNEPKNTEIATMKGGTITALDFYDTARTQQSSQQIVFDLILSDVFVKHYGDEITDKDVEKELKELFGDDLDAALKQSGLTRKEADKLIRDRMAYDKGLRAHVKLTDADLKAAWEAFHPEVEAQIISVLSEEEAADMIKKAKEKDADFGKLAKENSLHSSKDDNGKVTFSSATDASVVPAEVKAAAFELKDGEISEAIPVASQYGTTYYVVKMVKTQEKGNDMSKFEKEVKEAATTAKLADQAFINKAIGEELIKANVKVKDEAFATLLTPFIDAANPPKASDSSDKEETKDSSTDKEKTDETTDETTDSTSK